MIKKDIVYFYLIPMTIVGSMVLFLNVFSIQRNVLRTNDCVLVNNALVLKIKNTYSNNTYMFELIDGGFFLRSVSKRDNIEIIDCVLFDSLKKELTDDPNINPSRQKSWNKSNPSSSYMPRRDRT